MADAYDAMTSPRPYRPPMSQRQVVGTLQHEAGSQWDPEVVAAFPELIEEEREETRFTVE